MIFSRRGQFNASRYREGDINLVLRGLRFLGLGLSGVLLWTAQGLGSPQSPEPRLSLLLLWLVAAALGWLLSRQYTHRLLADAVERVVSQPLWTFLICSALYLAVNQPSALLSLTVVHLFWTGYTLIWRITAQRMKRPLRIGVNWLARSEETFTGQTSLLADRRIAYVPLGEQNAWLLGDVDAVLAQDELSSFAEHQTLLRHAQLSKVPIWSKLALDEELTGQVSLERIERNWLDADVFQSRYAVFKRILDVLVTLLALPLLLPLMLGVALVVRFNSGSPVLFWQERVGQNGKTFNIAKFRTMTTDSEKFGAAFARQGDKRITPVGVFLRKFRLDELPQFWNVLRGEMSIIGPRPEQWAFAADFEESIPLYGCRHWVRPGITGWAQVNQGYADNLGQTIEKLRYDFYYVKHFSLGLDVIVVGKTIQTILNGFGAR